MRLFLNSRMVFTSLGLVLLLNAFGQDIQHAEALLRFHSFGSAASLNAITTPAPQIGSMAYRSDLGKLVYRNNSGWVELNSGGGTSSPGWSLTGNAIGGNINNFVGTTDNSNFHIKSNNIIRLTVLSFPSNRHRVIFPAVQYAPSYGSNETAVFGINGTQGRLRITAADDDTFDNSKGASIDLHGNTAETGYAGRLDLVAGNVGTSSTLTTICFHTPGIPPPYNTARFHANGQFVVGIASPAQLFTVGGNAAKPGGGSWNVISDRRIKKNIKPYNKGLDYILKIKTVNFQYTKESKIAEADQSYVGVIAQEMEKVLPSTVSMYNDSIGCGIKDLRMFESSELLFTLINAVKELHQDNIELEKENMEDRKAILKLMKEANLN